MNQIPFPTADFFLVDGKEIQFKVILPDDDIRVYVKSVEVAVPEIWSRLTGGAMLICDPDIWTLNSPLADLMFDHFGLPRPISQFTIACSFEECDMASVQCLAILTLLSRWECWLIDANGKTVLFIDHDGALNFVRQVSSELKSQFSDLLE